MELSDPRSNPSHRILGLVHFPTWLTKRQRKGKRHIHSSRAFGEEKSREKEKERFVTMERIHAKREEGHKFQDCMHVNRGAVASI